MRVLLDADVHRLGAAEAVVAMRDALRAAWRGELLAPPRVRATAGDGLDYVFTVGGRREGVSGFRAYRAGAAGEQLVAVWDAGGRLRGLVVGDELGARRTGALGGAAADALAREAAGVAGVIGSGRQAWTQLWALSAVRPLAAVRVFSRSAAAREAFAARAQAELVGERCEVVAVSSAAAAVRGADLVVLATRSESPVIDAADVSAGAHVVTVGPKTREHHELPLELVDRAAVITCDAPAQALGYGGEFVAGARELTHLGAVLAGDARGRTAADELTLHCSVGLAGTEVVLAEALLRELAA